MLEKQERVGSAVLAGRKWAIETQWERARICPRNGRNPESAATEGDADNCFI